MPSNLTWNVPLDRLIKGLQLRKKHSEMCPADRARMWTLHVGKLNVIWDRDGHNH